MRRGRRQIARCPVQHQCYAQYLTLGAAITKSIHPDASMLLRPESRVPCIGFSPLDDEDLDLISASQQIAPKLSQTGGLDAAQGLTVRTVESSGRANWRIPRTPVGGIFKAQIVD